MKLIQSYSRSCSVDIKHKPSIVEKYFPLPGNINKYITIQNSSGMGAKDYDWYQECVDLIFPILQKNNIQIILLGAKDTKPLNGTIDLRGQTSIAQSAFIVKNGLLHVGNDSWIAHYAGSVETPLISLYGSTSIENHSPYHYNKDKTVFLESHRNGNRPTFAREENPKTINLIDPIIVAQSICKLLNLEFSYSYSTLFIGQNYDKKIIESACDSVIDVSKMGVQQLIMRLDLNFDLNILQNQLKVCPCQLITDKPLPPQLLKIYQPRIIDIIYKIDENHNPEFVKNMVENKIKYQLISDLPIEKLNNIKFDYLDFNLIFNINKSVPKELKDKILDNIYYKTSKLVLSKGKFYSSVYDYCIGRSLQNPMKYEPQNVLNKIILDELWKESDFCIFMEKT